MLHALRGAVVDPAMARDVAIPPYDAMTPEVRAAWRRDHPWSYLNVLPDGPVDDDVLARCRAALQRLRDHAFVDEETPFLAVYELTREGRTQRGLVADLDLRAFADGRVHAHERTRRDREDELVAHLSATGATSSPVCLTHTPDAALRDALAALTRDRPPRVTLADDDAVDDATSTPSPPVTQGLWVVDDPAEVSRLLILAGRLKDLVVTDGHHRAAAAGRVATEGDMASSRLMVAMFPCDELTVAAFDRVVAVPAAELLPRLRELTDVGEPGPARRPDGPGQAVLATAAGWHDVALPPPTDDQPRQRLDVVRLQHLLAHGADVLDPRGDPRVAHLPGIGTAAMEAAVGDGSRVGFALWPTGIDEIVTIATAGGTLPPKSTYVIPKARSGLLLVPRGAGRA